MEGSTMQHDDDDTYESFGSWEDVDYFPNVSSGEEDLYSASPEGKATRNSPTKSTTGRTQIVLKAPSESPRGNGRNEVKHGSPQRITPDRNRSHQMHNYNGRPDQERVDSCSGQSSAYHGPLNQSFAPRKTTARHQRASDTSFDLAHERDDLSSFHGGSEAYGEERFEYKIPPNAKRPREEHVSSGTLDRGKLKRGQERGGRRQADGFGMERGGNQNTGYFPRHQDNRRHASSRSNDERRKESQEVFHDGLQGRHCQRQDRLAGDLPQRGTAQAYDSLRSQHDQSDVYMDEEYHAVTETETSSENTTVEVSKFKSTTSEDTLRMYFENTRKSGGGEISEFDFNQDVVNITFRDPSVAELVARRTHKLEGATLTVIPAEKKKARPKRPVDRYRLLLTGIPDGVEQDTLQLFIEGRTKIDEDPDIVYGEQPGTAMLTYSTHIKDIKDISQNFQKRKLKNTTVTASLVEFADCILVQNLKPGTSLDTVELYFENERKSGGGIVRDVQLDEEKNQAVVYFEDWKVVERVTKRPHKLSQSILKVTRFYDCLGAEVSTDGPTPRIPKPVIVQVNPIIAEYVFESDGLLQSSLEQQMMNIASKIEWPHEQNKGSIKITPDTTQGKDPRVWKDWNKKATQKLQESFSEYNAEEFTVEQPFWDEICKKLQQMNLNTVRPLLRSNEGTIILRGQSKDVKQAKHQLTILVDDLEKTAERARKIIKRRISIRPEKFKLLCLCGVKDEVEQHWKDVKFTLLQSSNEVECEGMQIEVSEAHIAIFDKLDKLSEHTTEISAKKGRFINHVHEKILQIFYSRSVHASCGIDGCKLTVIGKTEQETRRAIVYLQNEIAEKTLQVDNEATINVLQSSKGKQCFSEINSTKAVLADVNLNTRQVEITGFKNDVENALGVIEEFIEKNVVLEKHIKVIRGKVRYLTEQSGTELLDISHNNQQHSVMIKSFTGGRQSGFLVTGTNQGMNIAVKCLTNLIEKVVDQQHPVAKPGIPQLLRQEKGKRFLKMVEKDCNCVVDTNSSGLDSFEEDSNPGVANYTVQILRRHTLPGGCVVMVCKGDLTKERVDAIVNAANTKLEHVGGLAKAILDAGGETIQRESDAIIRKNGSPLNTGEVAHTSSGNLPCRHVLHVAGPKWDSRTPQPSPGDDPTHEENLLYDSVTNVLREAKRRQLKTVSIPAISSGIYGFPIHLCAKSMVEATVEFSRKNKSSSLREIRFTNIDQRACDAFLKHFQQEFGEEDRFDSARSSDFGTEDVFRSLRGASGYFDESSTSTSRSSSVPVTQAGRCIITTNENKTITLKRGDIAAERVDVLVNTTSGNVQLAAGGVSRAILLAAGPQLQQECSSTLAQSGQTGLGEGGILETGPAQLPCKSVYHTVCGHYNGRGSESILSDLVIKVLRQANQARMQSIAFPAIGTGNLKFPHAIAAQLMYKAAVTFSQQNPQSSLVDIRFVLYHKDRPTIQAFEAEMQRLVQQGAQIGSAADDESIPAQRKLKTQAPIPENRPREGSSSAKSYEGYRSSSGGTTQMQIGPIKVQVCSGDLTKESTEAIVNSVGRDLDLSGPVSQAIIQEGGRSIAEECKQIKQKGGKELYSGVTKTRAGTLNCNMIIHVTTPHDLNQLKDMVGKALHLAEKEHCRSIAFPALGTGNIRGNPGQAAEALLDAVGDFAASGKAKHLLLVKVTIFRHEIMRVFQKTMSSKEGETYKAQKNWFQRGADFVKLVWSKVQEGDPVMGAYGGSDGQGTDVDNAIETMILHIFAGHRRNLQQAKEKIDEFIEEEYCREEILYESEVWGDLSKQKMDRIFAIARQNSVSIEPILTGHAKRILIEGRTIDVKTARADIQKYFTDIQLEKKRELEGRLMNKEVQWRYKDNAGHLINYGDDINPLIERAYKENKLYKDLELEEGKIRIDFGTMKERDMNGIKVDIDIERIDLKKESKSKFSLPANWIPMQPGQNATTVKLLQTTKEYTDVETTFKTSIGRNVNVIEIQRIQNEELFKQYTAKKDRMVASTTVGYQVERQLYHGTAQPNCDKISANGFNRSFHGANGTALGKGTYFARDASYSNGYAKPSGPSNYQHMYLCKVLTGEYTLGNNTMIAPPAKPGKPSELFDSVVNANANPSVFVVFHDAQAFPEYLIIFK